MNVAGTARVMDNKAFLFRRVVTASLYCLCVFTAYLVIKNAKSYLVMTLVYFYSSVRS